MLQPIEDASESCGMDARQVGDIARGHRSLTVDQVEHTQVDGQEFDMGTHCVVEPVQPLTETPQTRLKTTYRLTSCAR